jgi:hypothetical protein
MKKRTFTFDEYQNKLQEGFENIGFRTIQEDEEESIDNLDPYPKEEITFRNPRDKSVV